MLCIGTLVFQNRLLSHWRRQDIITELCTWFAMVCAVLHGRQRQKRDQSEFSIRPAMCYGDQLFVFLFFSLQHPVCGRSDKASVLAEVCKERAKYETAGLVEHAAVKMSCETVTDFYGAQQLLQNYC